MKKPAEQLPVTSAHCPLEPFLNNKHSTGYQPQVDQFYLYHPCFALYYTIIKHSVWHFECLEQAYWWASELLVKNNNHHLCSQHEALEQMASILPKGHWSMKWVARRMEKKQINNWADYFFLFCKCGHTTGTKRVFALSQITLSMKKQTNKPKQQPATAGEKTRTDGAVRLRRRSISGSEIAHRTRQARSQWINGVVLVGSHWTPYALTGDHLEPWRTELWNTQGYLFASDI